MRFAMLIYETPEAFASRAHDDPEPYRAAWRLYHETMTAAGVHAGGDPLDLPHTGATVCLTGGKPHVQDGPYADTKEQLAGVAFLELPSLEEAIAWAARCPAAAAGAVEVRPLAPEAKRRITGTE
ncbi:MAG: YciI family protein [Terriglobales bacterium]